MPFDPTQMKDWQIAAEAEKNMPTPEEYIDLLGLEKDELIPYGRTPRVDFLKVMERLKDKEDGKYIEVTAITPTPLGEGKTTATMGLWKASANGGKMLEDASVSLPAGLL